MKTLLLVCLLAGFAIAQDSRPNILFIFADDHAEQAISAYGSRINRTPHIDRIAAEGAIFRNSFCANSICAPSRATILTGQHSHINGLRTNADRFDGSKLTLPKALRGAGYQTALIGKWHLKSDPTGFDHWEILRGQGNYYNPVFRTAKGRKKRQGYATDLCTDMALEWLKGRDQKRPFLLMCQHKAPHRNWSPAPRHLHLYDDVTIPEPPTLFDSYEGRSKVLGENEMTIARHFHWDYDLKIPRSGQKSPGKRAFRNNEYARMTPAQKKSWDAAYGPKNAAFRKNPPTGKALIRWKYQRYIKDYLRCIQAVDESVGRLLDWLDANGLAENTLVVYASDQGFYLGEHGWYDKRWMFEESMRMPLLMRWPKAIRPATKVEALVQNIDYMPTFLDAAGVAIPSGVQGRTLLPLLRGGGVRPWRDALYYAYYELGTHHVAPHDGVRTRRHKLMYFPKTEEWQLFDLEQDPFELRSVHALPGYAGLLQTMKGRLRALRTAYRK